MIQNHLVLQCLTYLTIIDNPNWPTERQRRCILHIQQWHRTSGTAKKRGGVGRPGHPDMKSGDAPRSPSVSVHGWMFMTDLTGSDSPTIFLFENLYLKICSSDGLFRWVVLVACVLLDGWFRWPCISVSPQRDHLSIPIGSNWLWSIPKNVFQI